LLAFSRHKLRGFACRALTAETAKIAENRRQKWRSLNFDDLVKSLFPLPWWEGIKGRGKITYRRH
jgi:ribosomal protein L34